VSWVETSKARIQVQTEYFSEIWDRNIPDNVTSVSKIRFNTDINGVAQMEDNAWLRRISHLTDFSACGDMDALADFQNSLRELINDRWRLVEELQAPLANAKGNFYKYNWTQDAIDHEVERIKAIEVHLAPADWDARVEYLTRQLLDLPMNLRYEVIAKAGLVESESEQACLPKIPEDIRSTRVQLRISHEEHRDLRILCKHSSRTISEIVRLAVLGYDPRFELFKEMHEWRSTQKLNSKLYVRLPAFLYEKLEAQTRAHRSTTGATLRAMLRRWVALAKLESRDSLYAIDWDEEEDSESEDET
jgi:hypothetical protein